MNDRKRIISYLESQKEHIIHTNGGSAVTLAWVQNLRDYLRDLFGDGEVVKQLNKLSFIHADDANYVEFVINEAIKKVQIGAYIQKDKKNFLRKLSDSWLIAIMSLVFGVIFPAVYSAGFWFGAHSRPVEQNTQANPQQHTKAIR